MRTLVPCRICGRHVFSDEAHCPFCTALAKRSALAPALVGGALLVAAACSNGTGGTGGQSATSSTSTSSERDTSTASTVSSTSTASRGTTTSVVTDAGPDAADACSSPCADPCFCGMSDAAYAPPTRSDWA